MAQGNALRPARGSWGHVAKLVRMLHMGLGPGTLGQLYDQLSSRPHRELAMPLPYLDHSTGERRGSRQAVQHPIVGEVAIPPHFALLGSKAFPGKRLGEGRKRFLLAAFAGPFMGRAMDAAIDALTPGCRLTIEVIDIGERDAWPEILFDKADRALDLPLRLGRVGFTDAGRDPNGSHEVGKQRVPARLFLLHFEEHAFHAVGESGFG